MPNQKKSSGRKDHSSTAAAFTTRLAAYSATAVAAVLVTPSVEAVGGNVAAGTNFSGASSLPMNFSFASATFHFGPLHGSFGAPGANQKVGSFSSRKQRIAIGLPGGAAGAVALSAGGVLEEFAPGDSLTGLIPGGAGAVASHFLFLIGPELSNTISNRFIGPLKSGGTGYFAFRAGNSGDPSHSYYGWMRVKVKVNASNFATSIAFDANASGLWGAYMSTDDPHFVDFKVGSPSTVPEPATMPLAGLGLLALGAAGVREMRRRKAVLEN